MSDASVLGGRQPWDPATDAEAVRELVRGFAGRKAPLLEILIALNEAHGHVDPRAIPVIAEELNLSRADVHGVASFYHDLRSAPAGRHVIKVCCAEACQAQGAHTLLSELETAFGIVLGETTPDGQVTLEPVYCLGNCALGPAALIDGELAGRCDAARVLKMTGRMT